MKQKLNISLQKDNLISEAELQKTIKQSRNEYFKEKSIEAGSIKDLIRY